MKSGFVPVEVAVGCGCLMVFALGAMFMVGVGVFALNNGDSSGSTLSNGPLSDQLSSMVPPNYAQLFSDAENFSGVPAPMVAALYLTERHSDSFGADLPSLDYVMSPCKENASGAAGPMQFVQLSWNGVVDDLQGIGITNPDRCAYKDSIIGAGFLLKGKFKYAWVQESCSLDAAGNYLMTDECISRWGQSYCGVKGCNDANCGAPDYLYCEEVVRKYHIVIGGV